MSQHTELIAKLIALSEMLDEYEAGGFKWSEEAATARDAADALQALERVPMTEEADELLRKWNLDPDLYRTDSGALNHMKIAAALKHPDDYPHTAQTAVKSESLAQAAQALARLPSEGKPIEALAPTEAQEWEAFEAEFDQLCKDYSIYGLIEARLCKVFFEAGRAGSKP